MMNKYLKLIKYAYKNLLLNKGRSFMSLIGIVIGISTVSIVISIGFSAEKYILSQVNEYGSDTIFIETQVPKNKSTSQVNADSARVEGVTITSLKVSDAEKVLKLPNIKNYYAAVWGMEKVNFQDMAARYMIQGVSPSYIEIDASEISEGRFFTNNENLSLKKVAVIGSEVAKQLFKNRDPINNYISLKGIKFKVIGVTKPIGMRSFINYDEMVLTPLKTAQKLVYNLDYIPMFAAQVDDVDMIENTSRDIRHLLAIRHNTLRNGKDDFRVTTVAEAVEVLGQVTVGLQLLLFILAFISLIVGGVGIMNIMLASISERLKEIGIRKALGASKKDIQMQFLLEAMTLTFVGGVIGVLLGTLLTYLIGLGISYSGVGFEFLISKLGLILALLMAVIEGFVFGYYPAKKASEMLPIETIRRR